MKGFVRKFTPLEILSKEQVESIHQGTLQVLEETGIRFDHEKAMDIFEANRCKVDRERKRVRFPATLVEKCLSLCPPKFSVKARDPKHDLVIGGDTLYFISGCGTNTVDLDTWESRPATKEETIEGIKILDALDNLHMFLAFSPYFGWDGLPPVMGEPEMTAAKARYSTKVQKTGSINDSEVFAIKMAKTLGCEVLGIVNPSPPLTYYSEAAEAIFRYTEADLPFHVSSGATMGLSGPASIVGSTITNNAELIAGVVLAQLLKPGSRVWVGNFVNAANMRNGSIAFGSIANSLTQVAFNQIWRRYGIPVWSATPAYSSAKTIDFQCGYEKGIAAILAAVSGSHAIHMHGGLHGELTYHPVQSILDDDIAGMVGHFLNGVEVGKDTLLIELINKVGPIPGHYFKEDHTIESWKTIEYIPRVADRLSYEKWISKGKKGALELAKERMQKILNTHKPIPLSREQDQEIEEILDEARSYYKEKRLM